MSQIIVKRRVCYWSQLKKKLCSFFLCKYGGNSSTDASEREVQKESSASTDKWTSPEGKQFTVGHAIEYKIELAISET